MHQDRLFTPWFYPDQTLLNLWERLPTPHLDRHLRPGETRDGLAIQETGIVQDDHIPLTHHTPFHCLQDRMAFPQVFEHLVHLSLRHFRDTAVELPPPIISKRKVGKDLGG